LLLVFEISPVVYWPEASKMARTNLLTPRQAIDWAHRMNLMLMNARAELAELDDPSVLPIELIGIHHVIQSHFACYTTLIISHMYGNLPQHHENELLFEEYMTTLPP
jgi:hypothetical protein